MIVVALHPADPERDFVKLAAMFTILEDQPNSESGLRDYYEQHRDTTIQKLAELEPGEPAGFYWAELSTSEPRLAQVYVFASPQHRGRGIGRALYADLMEAMRQVQVKTLRVSVWDSSPDDLAFAERRGFTRRGHSMAMSLDLRTFDDRPYDPTIARLQAEGFHFTSMEQLGDTEEAQHKLYILNDTAASTTPGSEGEHPWASFEEFRQNVCQSNWYKPGGQMVVIDTATGAWAAMSAITRFESRDYAYNLFTGVDMPYRGRKLAQAVKVLALRYARDVLNVDTVRTHHNSLNAPMIAIDQKLGYVERPGTILLEKSLD